MDAKEPRIEKIEYTEKFVAFIDILGFKNLILNSDLGKSRETIRFISDSIGIIRRNLNANNITDFRATYFSDNICISSSIDKLGISISYLIHAISEFQLFWALRGIFVRGGISVGRHYEDNNIIFSRGLVIAHFLEVKNAVYPRIIIDKDLLKTISRSYLETTQNLQLICCDESDDRIFIDYLAAAGPAGEPIMPFDDIFLRHKDSIVKQIKQNIGDSHTLDKYRWLARYHNYKLDSYYDSTNFKRPLDELSIGSKNEFPQFNKVSK
jgi:hypothetical protein